MLVLSRNPGEKVLIEVPELDHLIEVVLVEVRGNKVRLGFHADKRVAVYREEVYNQLKKDKIL